MTNKVVQKCWSATPGHRVYFGRDGDTLIILPAVGTKKRRQQADIDDARDRWADYIRRKEAR